MLTAKRTLSRLFAPLYTLSFSFSPETQRTETYFSVLIVFHAMQLQRSGEGHQKCGRVPVKSRAETAESKAHLDQLRHCMKAQSLQMSPAPNYGTCPRSLRKLSSEVGVWRHGEWFLLCLLDKRLVILWL